MLLDGYIFSFDNLRDFFFVRIECEVSVYYTVFVFHVFFLDNSKAWQLQSMKHLEYSVEN